MTYHQIIQLKNSASCCLRSGTAADGQAALDNFILTHAETDNLLTYPEENTLTATQEGEYLQAKTESPNEVEILAIVDGKVAGTAGINAIGGCYKLQHRAEFGISIAKEFWGLGIGQALTAACIDCARKAGYAQLELEVLCRDLTAVLQNDPEVLADKVTVTVDTFNAYSIDLRCRMYVTTTRLADFLQAKNRLNLQIMDVVHKDGCDFAFPTTTIEMAEKK